MAPLKEMTEYEDEQRQAKFAMTEIHSAESVLNEAKRNNININEPIKILEQARVRFDSKEFQRAVELSLKCKKLVYSLMSKKV
ncbi:MAG: hypothetical protein ACFFDT_23015 [Candidatus Hodarchaeota archaeon]